MSIRGGYDVVEAIWIKETEFGTTPATGEWGHFGDVTAFDPRRQATFLNRVGLGRVIEKDFILTKEWAELLLEIDILKKDAGNGHEWVDILNYAMGLSAPAETIDLERKIASLSIGAKLDLTTDEYMHLKGLKINRYELRGEQDSQVKLRLGLLGQDYGHSETDYVVAPATRATFPTTEPIVNADCDIKVNAVSQIASLDNWAFSFTRELEKKGSKTGAATQYGHFYEEKVGVELQIVRAFDSVAELNLWLNNTKFNAELHIPTGTGGRKLTLSDGRWQTGGAVARELELMAVQLTGRFCDLAITTL